MDLEYGTEQNYLDNVSKLINVASSFLDSLRVSNLFFLHSSSKSRIEKMISYADSAQLGSVRALSSDFETLNEELKKLTRKFRIVKKSYKTDSKLVDFLGDFQKNPKNSYKKLRSLIDGSINQIDAVVASYAAIEKKIKPAKNWAHTILSHQSKQSAIEKARQANQIIKAMETLIEDLRGICQDAKVDLLDLRSDVRKYTKSAESSSGSQMPKGKNYSEYYRQKFASEKKKSEQEL